MTLHPTLTLRRAAALTATAALLPLAGAYADDSRLPGPPWQVHVSEYMVAGVVWNEAAVRKLLPPGVKPAADMSGGVAIYKSDRGYGVSPYDSFYLFVNVEGADTAQGAKGRWILAGAYGPDERLAGALRTAYGWQVRTTQVEITETTQGRRAVARVGGKDVLEMEVKSSALPCDKVAGINNYVGSNGGKLNVNEIPFIGDWCGAELVKLNVLASGDPIAQLLPAKVTWAGEFRDGSIAFTRPVSKP
jgi:hypothetical protein